MPAHARIHLVLHRRRVGVDRRRRIRAPLPAASTVRAVREVGSRRCRRREPRHGRCLALRAGRTCNSAARRGFGFRRHCRNPHTLFRLPVEAIFGLAPMRPLSEAMFGEAQKETA